MPYAFLSIKTLRKRDFLLNEIPKPESRYYRVPDEFEHVKDVPAIFTINKFNFTKVGSKECGCAQPVITDQEEFTINIFAITYGQ